LVAWGRRGGFQTRPPPSKFPSWEGWREAPGWFPAPCAGCAVPAHRHCEVPQGLRYVQCIGTKQSSAGGITYVLRIADYYVNPGLLRRISLTTYHKCGGGFAMTVRRGAHHGQGQALSCPRALRGNVGRGCALRGKPPRRLRRHPSQEGNLRGRAGLKPSPTKRRNHTTFVQTLQSPPL
jgi:hypothetical protein